MFPTTNAPIGSDLAVLEKTSAAPGRPVRFVPGESLDKLA
jgi:hypothetical protein